MDKNKISAVVLAGGGSARMGTNKALLKLGKETMVERVVNPLKDIFDKILVVTNRPEDYGMLEGVKFVKDCINTGKKSSLIGLYSGLKQSETSHIFAIGCDMPFINKGLIKYMVDSLGDEDIVAPFINGYYQPLHAIYGKTCIGPMELSLKEESYKITAIFNRVNVKKLTEDQVRNLDPLMLSFENINTHGEYLQIKGKFS